MTLLSAARFSWGLSLLALPLTSFPLLPLGDAVSPLSIVFVMPALALCLLSDMRRRALVRSPFWILVLFVVFAMVFTLWGVVGNAGPVSAAGVAGRGASALDDSVTLLIGIAFYATAILMTANARDLSFTLKWLVVGLSINVVVALMQGVLLLISPSSDDLMHSVTSLVAVDQGARGRAYGLTLEPSWLVSQLTLIGLPVLFFWSLTPSAVRRLRIRGEGRSVDFRPTVPILAAFMAAIVLTFSRAGLMVAVASLAIMASLRLFKVKSAKDLLVPMIALPLVAVVISGGALLNPYVRAAAGSVINTATGSQSLVQAAGTAGVSGRLAFWATAGNTFLTSPVTGVGLGQSPFYFSESVPAWAVAEVEIAAYLSGETPGLPNAKNMVMRLLAETGVVGTVIFLAFVARHLVYALMTRRLEVTAFALLVAVALAVDFMSLDTFALPAFWWALALLWAIARIAREEVAERDRLHVPGEMQRMPV